MGSKIAARFFSPWRNTGTEAWYIDKGINSLQIVGVGDGTAFIRFGRSCSVMLKEEGCPEDSLRCYLR
jgi:hypothetical protein